MVSAARQSRRSARPPATLSGIARSMPQAKKLKLLREREAARTAQLRAEVDGWFAQFDTNRDGKLQRDELRALLTHLHPNRPPTEENLNQLIVKATEIKTYSMHLPGSENGEVSYHEARATVLRYADYCKDERYLDSVFKRFDFDGNGTLDEGELSHFLQAVAPEGCEVEDADIAYVMLIGDTNKDGVISRDEILPMVSKWAQIAIAKAERTTKAAPSPAWVRLRAAATTTGQALTPLAQKLTSVVSTAKAKEERKAVAASRWLRAEKQVLLKHGSSGGGDGGSEGNGSSGSSSTLLMRTIAAAKAEKAREELLDRAERAHAMAQEEEVDALEALQAAAQLDSPMTPRNCMLKEDPLLNEQLSDAQQQTLSPSGEPEVQTPAAEPATTSTSAAAEGDVEPVWEEFRFIGPPGQRALMPIPGSSMDLLARSRRGSLDHAVPGLDQLLRKADEAGGPEAYSRGASIHGELPTSGRGSSKRSSSVRRPPSLGSTPEQRPASPISPDDEPPDARQGSSFCAIL